MTVRKLDQSRGWAFTLGVGILKPPLVTLTRRTWIDGDKIPASGGCVVVVNHISHADPLTTAHFIYDHGRLPRYLAKSGLFENGLLSYFLRSAGQIPVKRLTTDAVGAYAAAVAGGAGGRVRGRLPRGNDHPRPRPLADARQDRRRPDRARDQLPGHPGRAVGRRRTCSRRTPGSRTCSRASGSPTVPEIRSTSRTCGPCRLQRGDAARPPTGSWQAITVLLEEIRGDKAPATRYDPRATGTAEIGNPHKMKKKGRRS